MAMTVERSRRVGQGLMAASGLALLLFAGGVARRSYAALAIPVVAGTAALAGLAFWVGYTMAAQAGGEAEFPEAEGAPPPETVAERAGQ